MIRTYSQRMPRPYTGMVQFAESERARALTQDGESWELHLLSDDQFGTPPRRGSRPSRFWRVAQIRHSDLTRINREGTLNGSEIDERILELTTFLANVSLPFPAIDSHEYWLLDRDGSPLALLFTCAELAQQGDFPELTEWAALSAATMRIEPTAEEQSQDLPPVNYRMERLIAERAGYRPKARWFDRETDQAVDFPPLLIREDWDDESARLLCQRYLQRQSPRLLMLQGLQPDDRLRMEQAAQAHAVETARYYPIYPEVIDKEVMNRIRVEARMRGLTEKDEQAKRVESPRRGILYI